MGDNRYNDVKNMHVGLKIWAASLDPLPHINGSQFPSEVPRLQHTAVAAE